MVTALVVQTLVRAIFIEDFVEHGCDEVQDTTCIVS